jgi:hypothetical protein
MFQVYNAHFPEYHVCVGLVIKLQNMGCLFN